jgi:protein tyrosine/serine phosphatase
MTRLRMLPHWGRALVLSASMLLCSAALAGCWAGYLQLTGNLHEIAHESVYRSAQLSPGELSEILREKHIRTVINLRGSNPGVNWYDDEVAITRQTGAQHISLRMSALRELDDALLDQLVNILRTAPKPLLIHCAGGADRTGLASALYELEVMRWSAADASDQLSFRYGHFPWLTSSSGAMDRTFWRVADKFAASPSAN